MKELYYTVKILNELTDNKVISLYEYKEKMNKINNVIGERFEKPVKNPFDLSNQTDEDLKHFR